MKIWLWAMALPAGLADAQVKDAEGRALRAGQPAGVVRDFNGGRIARGRPAHCRVGEGPEKACTFFPRNGDGSFAIGIGKHAYYADKIADNAVVVEYFNGARMVPQGRYVRDRRNPACWTGRAAGQRLCVRAGR